MHEHIARALYYLDVHLLYASIVWLAALLLTWFGHGSATSKYWIWVATSLNFIFPLGAVLDKAWAAHLSWAAPLGIIGDAANRVSQGKVAAVLSVAWLLGATLMLLRLGLRIHSDHCDAQTTSRQTPHDERRTFLAHGIPVRFTETQQAPAVDGVLNPYISLPHGIDHLLSKHELNAILIHELTHAKRRDNLIRLIHEVGLCVLWFHPFVWITGSRLALYRELSCDESVIQRAHGANLVSALVKLANPEDGFLLQASASSFISHRLARLTAAHPQPKRSFASALLTAAFAAVLAAGIFSTVAHTACCFALK